MKALIYRRISTNDTKQDIERQKEPLINFCKNKNFEIVGDFKDEISGTTKAASRTGYKQLLQYFKENDSKGLNVVFDEVSRLGRKKMDILQECEKFTQQGVNVHFVNPPATLLNQDGTINNEADLVITLYAQMA
jgi:DNA invertase Pin-like site-specific DNA recombinase